MRKPKKVRSIFIINRPFQLKYALLLTLSSGFIAVLFSIHIVYFCNQYFKIFLPNLNLNDNPALRSFIYGEQLRISIYLIVLILLLMVFMFFMGVVITHKIAGPMLVLKRKMMDIASGDFSARIRLRRNDEFKDMQDSFNEMADALERKKKKR